MKPHQKLLGLFVGIFFMANVPPAQTGFYIKPEPSGNGTLWDDAYGDLVSLR